MITFKQFLQEMPLAGIEYHKRHLQIDDDDEENEGSFSKNDRKVLKKNMEGKVYHEKLKMIPFPLYVYIADDYKLKGDGEVAPEGEIRYDHEMVGAYHANDFHIDLETGPMRAIMASIHKNRKADPKGVHFIMGDNWSDENQIAPTPWIVAHRFVHTLFTNGDRSVDAVKTIIRALKAEAGEDNWRKHLTMRSARSGKIVASEAAVELTTQYLMTGRINISANGLTPSGTNEIHRLVDLAEEALVASFKKLAGKVFYI